MRVSRGARLAFEFETPLHANGNEITRESVCVMATVLELARVYACQPFSWDIRSWCVCGRCQCFSDGCTRGSKVPPPAHPPALPPSHSGFLLLPFSFPLSLPLPGITLTLPFVCADSAHHQTCMHQNANLSLLQIQNSRTELVGT